MQKLRVEGFTISIDGFGAGSNQTLENPMGTGGSDLHKWALVTKTFQNMFGNEGGSTGVDDKYASRGFNNIGAWILGRNMFGLVRGPWLDDNWKGW
jgi:dihydrofolate reductase